MNHCREPLKAKKGGAKDLELNLSLTKYLLFVSFLFWHRQTYGRSNSICFVPDLSGPIPMSGTLTEALIEDEP
jgi:hypothetical protein